MSFYWEVVKQLPTIAKVAYKVKKHEYFPDNGDEKGDLSSYYKSNTNRVQKLRQKILSNIDNIQMSDKLITKHPNPGFKRNKARRAVRIDAKLQHRMAMQKELQKSKFRGKVGVRKPLPFLKSKKLVKRNPTELRKDLIRAIAAPDYNVYELAEQFQAPGSSTSLGIQCLYFSFNNGFPYGSGDPGIHKSIAYQISTAANPNIAYEEVSMQQSHMITSACNYTIMVEGWKLKVRRDLPNVTKYTGGIVADLQQGFLNNGNATQISNTSTDIFQANSFLADYKVVDHFKKSLAAGKSLTVTNNSKKSKVIRPSQFVYMTSGQTYSTGTLTLADRAGETYWLFRIWSTQLQNDVATHLLLEDYGAKVVMYSKTTYEYKYVQDINSVTNSFVGGVSTTASQGPGTSNDKVIINSLTGVLVNPCTS